MRIRHKVPSIFSLSMVDMLCCALGCVILIWLLNAKQSEDEAAERREEIDTILASARTDRETSQKLLAAAKEEYTQATDRVRALMGDREKAAALIRKLEAKLSELEKSELALKKQLLAEQEQGKKLAADMEDARGRIASLRDEMKTAQAKLDTERKKSDAQEKVLAEREGELRKVKGALASAQKSYAGEKERADGLDKKVTLTQKELAALGLELKDVQEARQKLEKSMASQERELVAATGREKVVKKSLEEKQLAHDEAVKMLARLDSLLKDRQLALDRSKSDLSKLEKSKQVELDAALKRILELTKEKQEATAEASRMAKDKQSSLDALSEKLALLEKEKKAALDRLLARLAQAEKDKQALEDASARKITQLEKDRALMRLLADTRFAGIKLTGKRVIFVVDASGSMGWVDERTKSPTKWPEVCATIARVMRSLPELEKYQLVIFNTGAAFPLGSVGRWLEYDAKTSPEQAQRALLNVTPAGGTNIYTALEAVFRYRAIGLDSVYFLSDGLPSEGEGQEEAKKLGLTGMAQSAYLGKKVRTMLLNDWNKPLLTQERVKVNTIGFFYESPDLGAFLWAMARENEGSFVGMSTP